MSDQETMSALPDTLLQPLPNDPLLRIERFARDLAWGSIHYLWGTSFNYGYQLKSPSATTNRYSEYIKAVWEDVGNLPLTDVLAEMGYLDIREKRTSAASLSIITAHVSRASFELLQKPLPLNVFISYRRAQSSALAMMIWAYLQHAGLNPFLDIRSITGGDKWHRLLEKTVRSSDVVIVMLAHGTLESEFVREEIRWARDSGARIVPVLHDGFDVGDVVGTDYAFIADLHLRVVRDGAISEDYYNMLEFLRDALGILRREGN